MFHYCLYWCAVIVLPTRRPASQQAYNNKKPTLPKHGENFIVKNEKEKQNGKSERAWGLLGRSLQE